MLTRSANPEQCPLIAIKNLNFIITTLHLIEQEFELVVLGYYLVDVGHYPGAAGEDFGISRHTGEDSSRGVSGDGQGNRKLRGRGKGAGVLPAKQRGGGAGAVTKIAGRVSRIRSGGIVLPRGGGLLCEAVQISGSAATLHKIGGRLPEEHQCSVCAVFCGLAG